MVNGKNSRRAGGRVAEDRTSIEENQEQYVMIAEWPPEINRVRRAGVDNFRENSSVGSGNTVNMVVFSNFQTRHHFST